MAAPFASSFARDRAPAKRPRTGEFRPAGQRRSREARATRVRPASIERCFHPRLTPVRVCTVCGRESPEGFGFCGSCGASLVTEAPSLHEVRKRVTICFCDVTGSTALGERLDPESLRRVMARYFEAMRQVVERHEGTVEKFIGDAVMAVFGVPVLHEDDALRAVRAAAEMREALEELNRELERDYDTTLALRIGLDTGEVVAGTEERLVTGDAVNVAARLEQAAQPGETLIGAETLRLVRDAVEAEPLEPLALKGKSERIAAYRLVAVAAGAKPVRRRLEAPMVGRERERRLLADVWERICSGRSCQLFTLLGPAGVGKSRLASEFLAVIEDATVLRGRCLSYGEGITYWPVTEMLKQLLGAEAQSRLGELALDEAAGKALGALLGEEAGLTSTEEIAGPCASCSRRWRRAGRSSASSTICTGARRPCSSLSRTSPT